MRTVACPAAKHAFDSGCALCSMWHEAKELDIFPLCSYI